MLIVGIDPHKLSHTAAALDTATGQTLGEHTIAATAAGYRSLLHWMGQIGTDLVAIENARGLGRHLADWLQAKGLSVVDVTTKEVRAQRLARRSGRNKNDNADALAAAMAASTGSGYRLVDDPNGLVANLLTEEREALNAEYTLKRNRLHAHLRTLRPGGAPTGASLERFGALLKGIRATTPVIAEIKRQARALLTDLRRLVAELGRNEQRMAELTTAAKTTLTEVTGIGAVTAAAILGAIGSIDRFASHHALAAFAGAAPKQIASGAIDRHRLDRNGNHRLRRALHVAARTQARHKDGPGRSTTSRNEMKAKATARRSAASNAS